MDRHHTTACIALRDAARWLTVILILIAWLSKYSYSSDTITIYNAKVGNYSATSNNMKLVQWPLMGGLLRLVEQGDCTKKNHPSTVMTVFGCVDLCRVQFVLSRTLLK